MSRQWCFRHEKYGRKVPCPYDCQLFCRVGIYKRDRGPGTSSSGSGFLPSSISGLVQWQRKGIGITGNPSVSNWADQSGNGHDLAQASGPAQPQLQGDGTILFDGATHFLGPVSYTLNQPLTFFFRLKQVTWTSTDRWCDGGTLTSVIVQENAVSPGIKGFAGTLSAEDDGATLGSYHSMTMSINGASSFLIVDQNTATTWNSGANNAGGFTLGAAQNGTLPSNIQVAEVGAYNVAVSQSDALQLNSYLSTL
jgi:hypothetical protein